jgi:hypothetical protein
VRSSGTVVISDRERRRLERGAHTPEGSDDSGSEDLEVIFTPFLAGASDDNISVGYSVGSSVARSGPGSMGSPGGRHLPFAFGSANFMGDASFEASEPLSSAKYPSLLSPSLPIPAVSQRPMLARDVSGRRVKVRRCGRRRHTALCSSLRDMTVARVTQRVRVRCRRC